MDLTIAAEIVLDAFAGAATEFALGAVTHVTIELIAAIAAIVFIIAAPASGYALGIVALKVSGVTGGFGGVTTGRFVLAIGTVHLIVAAPSEWNAATRIASVRKNILKY